MGTVLDGFIHRWGCGWGLEWVEDGNRAGNSVAVHGSSCCGFSSFRELLLSDRTEASGLTARNNDVMFKCVRVQLCLALSALERSASEQCLRSSGDPNALSQGAGAASWLFYLCKLTALVMAVTHVPPCALLAAQRLFQQRRVGMALLMAVRLQFLLTPVVPLFLAATRACGWDAANQHGACCSAMTASSPGPKPCTSFHPRNKHLYVNLRICALKRRDVYSIEIS